MTDTAPTFEADSPVPAVTADEMRAVDRVAVEETGPPLLSMMENAGRGLAERTLATGDGPVVVLAGGGGNGGGGLCAARHLHDHGRPVAVCLDRPPADLEGAVATQHRTLAATPVPVLDPAAWNGGPLAAVADRLGAPGVVVDAVVGYGLTDPLRGTAADLIGACESAPRVVSLDVPTGVDATTGAAPGPAVAPDATLTLALPKTGLVSTGGDLWLADIGIPPVVFERAGVDYRRPFDDDWTVALSRSDRE